eukprot:scaffold63_cov306-Pinguiococcus_pyrenoidosus.AAC.10
MKQFSSLDGWARNDQIRVDCECRPSFANFRLSQGPTPTAPFSFRSSLDKSFLRPARSYGRRAWLGDIQRGSSVSRGCAFSPRRRV